MRTRSRTTCSRAGCESDSSAQFPVIYDDVVVGDYVADLIVDEQVIVEVKACKAFDDVHAAQCLNYLKATRLTVCLLINFGSPKVQIKRVVFGLDEPRSPRQAAITALHASVANREGA